MGDIMRIGEVGLCTNDVNRLADFYKKMRDIEKAYQKVLAPGAEIIEKPARRPWGAVNMSFYDPNRNVIYFRYFPHQGS